MKKSLLFIFLLSTISVFGQFASITDKTPWSAVGMDISYNGTIGTCKNLPGMQFRLLSDSIFEMSMIKGDEKKDIEGKYWIIDSTLYMDGTNIKTGNRKLIEATITYYRGNVLKVKLGNKGDKSPVLVFSNGKPEKLLPKKYYELSDSGLTCLGIKLFSSNEIVQRNEFEPGEYVEFNFEDLTGITSSEGLCEVGMTVGIFNHTLSDTIALKEESLNFQSVGSASNTSLTKKFSLQGYFVSNLEKGQYITVIRIWDKHNSSHLTFTFPFFII